MRQKTNRWREACIVAIALFTFLIASISTRAQRKLFDPGRYEGENLVNSGKAQVNGGSVAAQPMSGFGTGWSGNAQLFWGGGSPGAVLDLMLDVPAEGIYEIELHMTKAPDFGRLRIQVENKNVGERFDGYAAMVEPSGAISLGTYDLKAGARKISFMIDGKNVRSSNYFAGIDFIKLNKMPTAASKTPHVLESTQTWSVTAMSIEPEATAPAADGGKAYKENQVVTVKCSYQPIVPGEARLRIVEEVDLDVGWKNVWQWVRLDVPVSKAGSQTTSFAVYKPGKHSVRCGVALFETAKWTFPQEQNWWYLDYGVFDFQVVGGIVPQQTKWPDAPIIETPIQGGKIVVKSQNPSSLQCTDGGAFLLEMQMAEEISPGHWGNWQSLKVMWKPLACVAEGSTKDISGMKPGHYQIRTRLINGKYKFTSDWSDWMFFDIPEK